VGDQLSERGEAVTGDVDPRKLRATTTSLAAVMFLTAFAGLAVVPTLPVAVRSLHGSSLYPLVAGVFVAASLLGGLIGGNWADRSGTRGPLAVGIALAAITLLVSATSVSIWQLAAGRFLDGLAAGIVAVAVNTTIARSYPSDRQARMLTLMSMCWILPSLAGPPVAGLVTAWWSWRVVFFALAALTALPALAIVLLLRRDILPASAGGPRRRPALLLAGTAGAGAALAQYGSSGWTWVYLAVTVAGAALVIVSAPRLLPSGTVRAARGLPATVLAAGLGSGVYFTIEAYVPLLLITFRHVPSAVSGLAFTAAALAWSAASWAQGHPLHDVPRHRLAAVGASLLAVAALTGAIGAFPETPAITAALALTVAAVGMGLFAPSTTLLTFQHAPDGQQGYASSTLQMSQSLGQMSIIAACAAPYNLAVHAHLAHQAAYLAAFVTLIPVCALAMFAAFHTRGTS
jgi:MFS family permease